MAVQVVVGVVSASLAVLWRLRWRHLYALRARESRNNPMTDARPDKT
jgi:hypothetical protein